MAHVKRTRWTVGLLLCALAFAACSSNDAESDLAAPTLGEAEIDNGETEIDNTTPATPTTTTTTLAPETETVTSDVGVTVAPLVPFDSGEVSQPDGPSASAYISRVTMSAESIELTWASRDGAVEYQLHRVPLSPTEPGVEVMTADNLIHTAVDAGRFVDDTVQAQTQYWYGVRAVADSGDVLAHGWHRADAVTDTDPPEPPVVSATPQDDGVLVEWTVPDEGYELHSYRVLRGVDGAEPEVIGQTWNVDQLSLLDANPPASGDVVYQVVAIDFHWNSSTPAEISYSG